MPTYSDAARELVAACDAYLNGRSDLAATKTAIWTATDQIVAGEDRDLRDFLLSAEGRLDIIEHTTDNPEIHEATAPIVREVRDRAAAYRDALGTRARERGWNVSDG